jgi:hypothetical protein
MFFSVYHFGGYLPFSYTSFQHFSAIQFVLYKHSYTPLMTTGVYRRMCCWIWVQNMSTRMPQEFGGATSKSSILVFCSAILVGGRHKYIIRYTSTMLGFWCISSTFHRHRINMSRKKWRFETTKTRISSSKAGIKTIP